MLSEDDGTEQIAKKKRKLGPENAKATQLLTKWGLQQDPVSRHVLLNLNMDELNEIANTAWTPDRFHQWHSPAELLARFTTEMRERKGVGGGPLDQISAFKFRHKLGVEEDRKLRALSHKDLRYVMANLDENTSIDELIERAAGEEAEDTTSAQTAIPEGPGLNTISRFTRLELIDPMADSAVFGDANLTFSLKLAKHRKALGHVGRVIATTFEELETLRERYKEINESIATLENYYAEVYHGVDCTRIAIDPKFEGLEGALGAVYYNFPHSGAIQGFFDSHPIVNWRHENLMRLFFRDLRSFVKPGGSVKVASNAGAMGVRYSYIVNSGLDNEFVHEQTMPFLEWHLHRYGRSYGDKRDSYKRPDAKNNQRYDAQAVDKDMVYCFTYAPSGNKLPKQRLRLPPKLKTIAACSDGPFRNLHGEARENLAKQLHQRFITEASGTHVG